MFNMTNKPQMSRELEYWISGCMIAILGIIAACVGLVASNGTVLAIGVGALTIVAIVSCLAGATAKIAALRELAKEAGGARLVWKIVGLSFGVALLGILATLATAHVLNGPISQHSASVVSFTLGGAVVLAGVWRLITPLFGSQKSSGA